MNCDEIITQLQEMSSKKRLTDMARFGININKALGISISDLRSFAKKLKKNHTLSLELWDTEIHEVRILAALIDDPAMVSEKQIESWVKEFDSWDLCDQVCNNLFDKTPFAYDKAIEWSSRNEEFIKRAGFVLMACLSVHDKTASNEKFVQFFSYIIKESNDDRNYVKKAVNWALRQIGKRNLELNKQAIDVGNKLLLSESKTAQWIAKDALRELTNEKIQKRVNR